MGMLNQEWHQWAQFLVGKREHRSELEGFSLMMTRVSIAQGNQEGSPAPRNLAKITLVWYLSMELHKGDLQQV